MSNNALAQIVESAREVGATDVEIKVKPDRLSIKHRVMGHMLISVSDLPAQTLVEATCAELAMADMEQKDAQRYSDWLQGRHSTFGFRLPGLFVQGQLTGYIADHQMVLRLFPGSADFKEFQQRFAIQAT